MSETLYDRCNKLYANKEVTFGKKPHRNAFTALPTGMQFLIAEFTVGGIFISMAQPGVRDMTHDIAERISAKNPGEFNTPELQKFKQSVPVAKPGLYSWNNTLVRMYHDILMYNVIYVEQNTKKPNWLKHSGEYTNPADWWSKKPKLLTQLPGAYWGPHPDGKGHDVIAIKQGSSWKCYIFGGNRPLSDTEITRFVGDKVFEPIDIKRV